MLFLGFSVKDRRRIAEPVLYNLQAFGVETWYDRERTSIGEDRCQKNFCEGVGKSRYAVLIISENTANAPTFQAEMRLVRKLHESGRILVFPIVYNLAIEEIPPFAQWVRSMVLAEIDPASGTRRACTNIALSIAKDLSAREKAPDFKDLGSELRASGETGALVDRLLSDYFKVLPRNLTARISLLYSMHVVLSLACSKGKIPGFGSLDTDLLFCRLFDETKLCLDANEREIELAETALRLEGKRLLSRLVEDADHEF